MARITVRIVAGVTDKWNVEEPVCVHEVPTEFKEVNKYDPENPKVQFERTFEMRSVGKSRDREMVLLHQEIEDDSTFNLADVIKAINGIS